MGTQPNPAGQDPLAVRHLAAPTPSDFCMEWDAENRLVTVEQGTKRSEFTYDGNGRRVRIVEKTSGVVTEDHRLVWCDDQICEERAANGLDVTKRYFGHGVQQAGASRFYATDHLGSVREVTDSLGAVRASYDYDPYGRRTKLAGDVDVESGFTGHYFHAPSQLSLTWYRAYDPSNGRWISEDPAGLMDGHNRYAYVRGNPINAVDPDGLRTLICLVYPIQKQPTRTKPTDWYGWCTMVGVCSGCPPTAEDPTTIQIKVLVYGSCPDKCIFVMQSGQKPPPINARRGPGLTLCSF